jgi:hypothetical protein
VRRLSLPSRDSLTSNCSGEADTNGAELECLREATRSTTAVLRDWPSNIRDQNVLRKPPRAQHDGPIGPNDF